MDREILCFDSSSNNLLQAYETFKNQGVLNEDVQLYEDFASVFKYRYKQGCKILLDDNGKISEKSKIVVANLRVLHGKPNVYIKGDKWCFKVQRRKLQRKGRGRVITKNFHGFSDKHTAEYFYYLYSCFVWRRYLPTYLLPPNLKKKAHLQTPLNDDHSRKILELKNLR